MLTYYRNWLMNSVPCCYVIVFYLVWFHQEELYNKHKNTDRCKLKQRHLYTHKQAHKGVKANCKKKERSYIKFK